MTTDPGDLVLDPTCGSGTTAYVAEQWGRRWITTDTSRVSLAIARQRLLTAKLDYYRLKDESQGIAFGFDCKTVPHVTLKSIAQNLGLDSLLEKWELILKQRLAELNHVLSAHNTPELRTRLKIKLADKERREGKKSITEADRRRWLFKETPADDSLLYNAEGVYAYGWKEWEVPFDTDPDWPDQLQQTVASYRLLWREKMDEINAAIAASAEQEELVDQPQVDRSKLRVSGPFTIEGVMPAEDSLDLDGDSPIGGAPVEELDTFDGLEEGEETSEVAGIAEAKTSEAYLDKMLRLLSGDAIRFPDNKVVPIRDLRSTNGDVLHAEGVWTINGIDRQVAVVFGPQYGPVTAQMVEECLPRAMRQGYDDLVIAGFSFDGEAHALIESDPNPRVRLHLAHIRPDVNMGDLLKNTTNSQLFTVSGLPRAKATRQADGQYVVEMEGVDIYDPVGNTIITTGASKVAAWFLDSDYDERVFCITQAFFPDEKAWSKIATDLKNRGLADESAFAAFAGTKSLPFPIGKHKRVAVKVIDPRGNEVMRVLRLDGVPYGVKDA